MVQTEPFSPTSSPRTCFSVRPSAILPSTSTITSPLCTVPRRCNAPPGSIPNSDTLPRVSSRKVMQGMANRFGKSLPLKSLGRVDKRAEACAGDLSALCAYGAAPRELVQSLTGTLLCASCDGAFALLSPKIAPSRPLPAATSLLAAAGDAAGSHFHRPPSGAASAGGCVGAGGRAGLLVSRDESETTAAGSVRGVSET